MTPPANTERYKNHRFPGEIISYEVWLYYRFNLSYESMELLGEHRPMLNKRTRPFGAQEVKRFCFVLPISLAIFV
jgi:putative transposase